MCTPDLIYVEELSMVLIAATGRTYVRYLTWNVNSFADQAHARNAADGNDATSWAVGLSNDDSGADRTRSGIA